MVPLKTRTGSALEDAFTKIIRNGCKPNKLQKDAGSEFKNRTFQTFLKEQDVHHFVTYNETKAQIVECFNRTLKQMMWRTFTTSSSYHYLDMLNDLVNGNYKQTRHRSIKMKPSEAKVFNAQHVWRTTVKYKFRVGDQVKASKSNRLFQKSYLPNYVVVV